MAGEERDLTNRDDSRPVRVKVDNVKKIYNTRNGEMVALNGVTLDIHDNEFICVVGPSGCGKSTLLNIIAGLLEPTSGAVYCDGKEVKGTGTDRGVVFQQYALFPWLTVKKNVMFALEMRGIKGKQAEEEIFGDGSVGEVRRTLSKRIIRWYETACCYRKSICSRA